MDDNGSVSDFHRDHPLSASVLVLNRNYTAVRVVSGPPGLRPALHATHAEVIDAHDEQWDVLDFQSWVDLSQQRRSAAAQQDQFVCTPRLLDPRSRA